MSPALAALRTRAALLGTLLAVIAVNTGILLSYRAFYDARLSALLQTRAQLQERRDEARRAAEKVVEAEKRLREVQGRLDTFYTETLGSRRERLAPLIEEIYKSTRRVGMRPDTIGYGLSADTKEDSLSVTFSVRGKYADVKSLLADLETSARLLVVDKVAVSTDPGDPDVVGVSLSVTHFFRGEAARPLPRVRTRTAAGATRPSPSPRQTGGRP